MSQPGSRWTPANRFQLGEAGFFAFGALTLAYATTALIIVSRRPHHPIGWILFFIGGMYGLSAAAAAYLFHLLTVVAPAAPAVLWAAWAAVITSFLASTALVLLIWLFPDGRSPIRAPWLPLLVAAGVLSQISGPSRIRTGSFRRWGRR